MQKESLRSTALVKWHMVTHTKRFAKEVEPIEAAINDQGYGDNGEIDVILLPQTTVALAK